MSDKQRQHLQAVGEDVTMFSEANACLQLSMIVSGLVDRSFSKQIHGMLRVSDVYVFGEKAEQYHSWKM